MEVLVVAAIGGCGTGVVVLLSSEGLALVVANSVSAGGGTVLSNTVNTYTLHTS